MIGRIRLVPAAVLTAAGAVVALAAPSVAADGAVPPSSAGQRWALKVNGYCVTVYAGPDGDMKLRANPDAAEAMARSRLRPRRTPAPPRTAATRSTTSSALRGARRRAVSSTAVCPTTR